MVENGAEKAVGTLTNLFCEYDFRGKMQLFKCFKRFKFFKTGVNFMSKSNTQDIRGSEPRRSQKTDQA